VSREAPEPVLRAAVPSDAQAINAIFNPYVLGSTATFALEPITLTQRQTWLADRAASHPVIVAEHDQQVVAWGSISDFHALAAYAPTGEPSVYVASDHHGQGLGAAILGHLIDLGRGSGLRSLISLVASDQPASIALHQKFDFQQVGHLREAGHKFDQWIDVLYFQKIL
jgi:L-amino acid N-acyltransferase YncA